MAMVRSGFQSHRTRDWMASASLLVDSGGLHAGQGLMIGTHNMCEETLFENELFRCEMKEAGVAPEEVDYINAHGTSTHHNDLFETRAICYALGDAAENVVVNSTKSMIGHLLGAAGAVEFVVCVKEYSG